MQFSKAVEVARELTNEKDTLIIVTSDHSHTFTIAGYSSRGKDILGLNSEISDYNNLPYPTLSYANGPSGINHYDMLLEESEMSKKEKSVLLHSQH